MSRYAPLALVAALLTAGATHAQVVTCAPTDSACRVQHNDAAVLAGQLVLLHADMQALLKQMQAAPTATTTPASAITTTPITTSYAGDVVTAFDPCAGRSDKWSTLKLAPSANIANALACAAPKFTLLLEPGTYNQVFHVPDGLDGWTIAGDVAAGGTADTVKVNGRGGCTVSQNNSGGCATRLAWGKGVIHVSSPGTVRDLEITGGGLNAMGDHDGQAGLYMEAGNGGTITAQHVMFRNNENGAFANTNATFDIVFTECDFVGNGTDGGSHSSYISGGKSFTLNNVHDYGSNHGNDQKTRVSVVTVNGGWFKSIEGRWVELADGGTLTVTGATLIGNGCCQNVLGNGTESTSKGTGNTIMSNVVVWLGRASNLANAGTFKASGITLTCASGAFASNDHGGDLTGFPACPANSNTSQPADVAFISGAKS